MRKPRVQVQRNTRTEIHADRRTRRRRSRSDAERDIMFIELDDDDWGPSIDWDLLEQEVEPVRRRIWRA